MNKNMNNQGFTPAQIAQQELLRNNWEVLADKLTRVEDPNDPTASRISDALAHLAKIGKAKDPKTTLGWLLNKSQPQYLKMRSQEKWMKLHNFSNTKQEENISALQFAKDFFQIMDQQNTGCLTLEQLAVPLITMGVTSDPEFIKMVFRNVNPNKFQTEEDFERKSLSIKEFTQIFKKDPTSEKLTAKLVSLAKENLMPQTNDDDQAKQDEDPENQPTISEVLREVKRVWYQLDKGRDLLELPIPEIAALFADEWRAVSDKGTAVKFIKNCIPGPKSKSSMQDSYKTVCVDWDEFNSIFCKGICRFTFVQVSKRMMQISAVVKEQLSQSQEQNQSNQDLDVGQTSVDKKNSLLSQSGKMAQQRQSAAEIEKAQKELDEKPLWQKMNNLKRDTLVDQLYLGRVKDPEQETVEVQRCVFDSLRKVVYKDKPKPTTEETVNQVRKMQHDDELPKDPYHVELTYDKTMIPAIESKTILKNPTQQSHSSLNDSSQNLNNRSIGQFSNADSKDGNDDEVEFFGPRPAKPEVNEFQQALESASGSTRAGRMKIMKKFLGGEIAQMETIKRNLPQQMTVNMASQSYMELQAAKNVAQASFVANFEQQKLKQQGSDSTQKLHTTSTRSSLPQASQHSHRKKGSHKKQQAHHHEQKHYGEHHKHIDNKSAQRNQAQPLNKSPIRQAYDHRTSNYTVKETIRQLLAEPKRLDHLPINNGDVNELDENTHLQYQKADFEQTITQIDKRREYRKGVFDQMAKFQQIANGQAQNIAQQKLVQDSIKLGLNGMTILTQAASTFHDIDLY